MLAAAGGVGIAAIQIAKGRHITIQLHLTFLPLNLKPEKHWGRALSLQHPQTSLTLLAWRAAQTL